MNHKVWLSMTVGERIRWLLEVKGRTQVDLAREIGLTQASISNWMTGHSRKPNAPSLVKLAEALGANAQWIVSGEGEPFGALTITDERERELVALLRSVPPKHRAKFLAQARVIASSVASPARAAKAVA